MTALSTADPGLGVRRAPARRTGRAARPGRRVRRAGLTALGILFVVIMIFPAYWMINLSLQNATSVSTADLFPLHPTLDAYAIAISQQLPHLVTSLIISLSTIVVTLVVAVPAAYALGRFRLPGGPAFVLILIVTQMVPSIVIVNSLYTLFNSLGLLNSYPGLILANSASAVPFAIILMRAFMNGIPAELIEAAKIDGASELRVLWSIVIPVSRNAIITAGLFTFLGAWGDFLFALTLTSRPDIQPITLGIYNYMSATSTAWGPIMATSVIASIPAAFILIFAQRFIAIGALGGALK